MAYIDGDIRVNVQGTLHGNEIWSNTWAVEGAVGLALKTEAVNRIHNFYSQISSAMTVEWHAQVATVTDLFANSSQDIFFDDVDGAEVDAELPQQLAVRISLTAGVGVQGGPFLAGFTTAALAADGLVDSVTQTLIADEVEDLAEELDAEGLALALDSPTNTALFTVHTVRVGQRFDVIRKRSNDVLESYITRLVP